ncbi:hypothetical protein HEK131_30710 [Streptomyces seoulensis]|nr:hypothetical protein HEK131_30710 [Streptomyces seoulensis]
MRSVGLARGYRDRVHTWCTKLADRRIARAVGPQNRSPSPATRRPPGVPGTGSSPPAARPALGDPDRQPPPPLPERAGVIEQGIGNRIRTRAAAEMLAAAAVVPGPASAVAAEAVHRSDYGPYRTGCA